MDEPEEGNQPDGVRVAERSGDLASASSELATIIDRVALRWRLTPGRWWGGVFRWNITTVGVIRDGRRVKVARWDAELAPPCPEDEVLTITEFIARNSQNSTLGIDHSRDTDELPPSARKTPDSGAPPKPSDLQIDTVLTVVDVDKPHFITVFGEEQRSWADVAVDDYRPRSGVHGGVADHPSRSTWACIYIVVAEPRQGDR